MCIPKLLRQILSVWFQFPNLGLDGGNPDQMEQHEIVISKFCQFWYMNVFNNLSNHLLKNPVKLIFNVIFNCFYLSPWPVTAKILHLLSKIVFFLASLTMASCGYPMVVVCVLTYICNQYLSITIVCEHKSHPLWVAFITIDITE